ncbi:MAG: hypothetical protein ACT4QD_04375 [Acidobacteriota bacterium]
MPTATLTLRSGVDSNSPAVWARVNGQQALFLFTSFSGWPTRHAGLQASSLAPVGNVAFDVPPPHGVWFESIIPDTDGTWYAYYHNELPAELCGDLSRTLPRIGAARSDDFGANWEDLGVVLEAPPGSHTCESSNSYFVGGVGDFSVMLDREAKYLYFYFSQYVERERAQGVAVARMPWASRDEPEGQAAVWWRGNLWVPGRRMVISDDESRTVYPSGTPIYRVANGWHGDQSVDAFWGPSLHWNTFLEQYVMLLNRAEDADFRQQGVYVAFSKTLSDPTAWSAPQLLISGGLWYPQVLGNDIGIGTDRVAGERPRFFLGGRSQYFIQFSR